MKQKITKSDSQLTRHSKKNQNNNLKRKGKNYKGSKIYVNSQNKRIRFNESIEKFLFKNGSLVKDTNKLVIKLNTDFSLFNNPKKVLLSLLGLLKHAKTLSINPRIVFDGHTSFGAIYLLDNLCWEIGKKRKWVLERKKFSLEDKTMISNIKSIVSSNYEDENECMINERVLINRALDSSANQKYKVKAKDITDMIERAIKETLNNDNYTLPLNIHGAIKSTIGEVFDNIHLHSLESEYGTLCGFYNKITKEVTLLIYNFGKTIFETLLTKDLPEEMFDDIEKVIKNHTSKRLINFTKNSEFSIENAITLLAIQEGISSRIKFDKSRGHGLMDFIEHCFILNDNSKISIISGSTAIKIDKTYKIGIKNVLGRPRRILALNSSNDIFEKPDSNYVLNTGINFNGVIIETIIPLNIQNNE